MVTTSSKSGTVTRNSTFFKKVTLVRQVMTRRLTAQCFNPKQLLAEILSKPVALGEQEGVLPDTARSCKGEFETLIE